MFKAISIFLLVLGLIFLFANPIIGGFVIFISLMFWGTHRSQFAKKYKEELLNSISSKGYDYKLKCSNEELGVYFALKEKENKILAYLPLQPPLTDEKFNEEKLVELNITKILNIELVMNDNAVYKAGPVASLASAGLGTLASGGFGAVAGVLSAGSFGKGKISELSIKMRVDNLDNPQIIFKFLNNPSKSSDPKVINKMSLAEEWVNLIELMRYRSKK